MQRRSFIRGIATAIALGMAPAFLNKTSLELAADYAPGACIGTMSVWKISDNGVEFISAKEIPVVDNGVNIPPYRGKFETFRFPVQSNITEAGIAQQGEYRRYEFEKPLVVMPEDELLVEYDYRLS